MNKVAELFQNALKGFKSFNKTFVLYEDIGQKAIISPQEGYRYPSPGYVIIINYEIVLILI